jgi:ligand-binding sensor domain-containing protein/class 3 adenylate cyclase
MNQFTTLLLLALSVIACDTQQGHKQPTAQVTKVAPAKPASVRLDSVKPPTVVALASMPNAQTVAVPSKSGGSFSRMVGGKDTKIDLLPPQKVPAVTHFLMKTYTTEDGLGSDIIQAMIRDKNGNLWFGTWGGGVSRYDGQTFTTYTTAQGLANNAVGAILQDRNGYLWFGTPNGVSRYDGHTFTAYSTAQGLPNSFVSVIHEDRAGNLWFGTLGGVSRYDGHAFMSYTTAQGLVGNEVRSMLQDRAGNLWFGTSGGVSRYDGQAFTNYTTAEGLISNDVSAIQEDRAGNLWFGTLGGVSRYDGHAFMSYTAAQGLVSNEVRSMLQDRAGNLWFGTLKGVSRYDGHAFTTYTTAQGLASNEIRSMLQDRVGNLWFGTFGGGVSRFDGQAFASYTSAQGLSKNLVSVIQEDRAGNLWFGTLGDGLIRYDRHTFTTYTTAQGLGSNRVISMLQDRSGDLWFGTRDNGVSRYDGKAFTTYNMEQGLAANTVWSILQDRDGNMWFGTWDNGVSRYDGHTFTNYSTAQGLPRNEVRSMLQDRAGNMWFGTFGGVSRYDGHAFTNYTTAQGLAHNNVRSLLEDRCGNLWFATAGGVSRFDGHGFVTYSAGLANTNFVSMTSSKSTQDLVFGTSDGLSILTGFIPKQPKKSEPISVQNNLSNHDLENYTPVFENYSPKAKYPFSPPNPESIKGIYVDSTGKLWFANSAVKLGVVSIDYALLVKDTTKLPKVSIKTVKLDNDYVGWSDLLDAKAINPGIRLNQSLIEEVTTFGRELSDSERKLSREKLSGIKFDGVTPWYPLPKNLVLPYSYNEIAFDFVAIETGRPQDVRYQYRLEGLSNDWSPPTDIERAKFTNLNEGTYEFKVRAKRLSGDWNEPTVYTFTVQPPWYRTWWAYSLYAISTLAVLFLLYRWRTAILRKRYEALQVLYRAAERFVPKTFLKLLKKEHIEDVKLGDNIETEITVLFTDIRGYTTLAEKLRPDQAYAFINSYWKIEAPIIEAHQGFISQYLGDGVMALFPRQADDAVEAVLDMMEGLTSFNEEQAKVNGHQIQVGYGLSTGHAVLGTIGTKTRMDANVISNTSNLSSRVESLNKYYGTLFLISDLTLNTLSDPKKYITRQVDKIKAKGMKNTIRLYEVYKRGGVEEKEQRFINTYEAAFNAYERGEMKVALVGFKECLTLKSKDVSSGILLERCEHLLESGLPENWDGTYEMTHK